MIPWIAKQSKPEKDHTSLKFISSGDKPITLQAIHVFESETGLERLVPHLKNSLKSLAPQ